jgi:tRNA(fMet)-specific endonuclease VapC
MFDTNICIYAIKKRPIIVSERLRRIDIAGAGLSAITLGELELGVEKSARPDQNRRALIGFLADLQVVPYDDAAAREYGLLRAHLEKRGTPIGSLDVLIAAHALALHATLVTNNESEFLRVPGLRVQNWAK